MKKSIFYLLLSILSIACFVFVVIDIFKFLDIIEYFSKIGMSGDTRQYISIGFVRCVFCALLSISVLIFGVCNLISSFKDGTVSNALRYTYEEYKQMRNEKKLKKQEAKKQKLKAKLDDLENELDKMEKTE